MYAVVSDARVGVYPDLWRKGRYRVELATELYFDVNDVDAALQELGYKQTDADQWGYSYCHWQDQDRTAELDEAGEAEAYVRLALRDGGLDEEDINSAQDRLYQVFENLYRMCRDKREGYYYESCCCRAEEGLYPCCCKNGFDL